MTRWHVVVRSVAKHGAPGNVNEDFAGKAIVDHRAGRAATLRLVVTDGATNAPRSDAWAELLGRAFLSGEIRVESTGRQLARNADDLAHVWGTSAPERQEWYVRAFESRGAFAALLGVEVRKRSSQWEWRALSVGDSILFIVGPGDRVHRQFPPREAVSFMGRPTLIGSTLESTDFWTRVPQRARGRLPDGAEIWLATDAVAFWAISQVEAGNPAWDPLRRAVVSPAAFKSFVAAERAAGRMPNDDSTVVIGRRT